MLPPHAHQDPEALRRRQAIAACYRQRLAAVRGIHCLSAGTGPDAVRRVEAGILDGSMRVVESGLGPDDRVIVLGVLKARPGAKVTPKAEAAAQAAR